MAYFGNAFCKMFWGGTTGVGYTPGATSVVDFVPGGTAGIGSFAFVDQDITNSATPWPVAALAPVGGQPLTLVATSVLSNDKIGPFHGGYQEVTKSKMINPRFINKFYSVAGTPALSHIIGVGATPNLNLAGADAGCCPQFFCDENYDLRLDLKGSPALRLLNHNAYAVTASYTGCCTGPVPEEVDPADVMEQWMNYITDDPILFGAATSGFTPATNQRLLNVGLTVTCDAGANWDLYLPNNPTVGVAGVYFEADGTTLTAAGTAFQADVEAAQGSAFFGLATPISTYTSIFNPAAPNCCAGLVMQSAFVETQFGDCTFMPTDHFEIEPLLIQASALDETGDPCVFEQLCISDGITPSGSGSTTVYPAIQFGTQAMGTGEQILRDLILSERYNTNDFNTSADLRIREITLGYDISDAVTRTLLYDCYFILHSVPRYNNPSGVHDNDQYLLKIPVELGTAAPGAFETFMAAWLTGANNPVVLETF